MVKIVFCRANHIGQFRCWKIEGRDGVLIRLGWELPLPYADICGHEGGGVQKGQKCTFYRTSDFIAVGHDFQYKLNPL